MATYDDGYSRGPSGAFRLTPVVKALLIANTLIALPFLFLVDAVPLLRTVFDVLALDVPTWREWAPLFPVWQLFTFGFLHDPDSPFHLLFNLMGLFFFGTTVESLVGKRRFLLLYALGIVVPGILQLALSLAMGANTMVVGASGAILMLLIIVATLYPSRPIVLLFVPMPIWLAAVIFVGLDLFGLIRGGVGTAYLVHLGGAALGFVLAKSGAIWFDPFEAWAARKAVKQVEDQQNDEQRLDELLARIHREGIGSLSGREREFLKRMSARRGERL
ncbi:MAG: rhomboid family intramembrane serine protease [Planctomycetaceae bacterium]|nr:rhomboid family intramembrane serine protease [Planctomycetaceae bacterium]